MNKDDEIHSRKFLLGLLHESTVIVTFTKKDGSKREMTCTLQEDKLPKREVREDATIAPRPVNEEIIKVFDLEANAWRSFRVESVTGIQFSI